MIFKEFLMQKHWSGYLAWLTLLVVLAMGLAISDTQAQLRLPEFGWGDFTWGFYGSSREYARQGREDTIAREGYCPTGGCIIRLNSVEIRPNPSRPGETLKLSTIYTILTPEQIALPIVISREIIYQGKSLGKTKSYDMRQYNGTWSQEVDFTLPATAVRGEYTLRTTVRTGYGSQQKDAQFQVN
jgi:hypothetical protein